MVVSRILAGRALFSKLPSWMALPAGAVIGLTLGYSACMPDASTERIALVVVALLAVLACGLLAPQPSRRGPRPTALSANLPEAGHATDDDSLFG